MTNTDATTGPGGQAIQQDANQDGAAPGGLRGDTVGKRPRGWMLWGKSARSNRGAAAHDVSGEVKAPKKAKNAELSAAQRARSGAQPLMTGTKRKKTLDRYSWYESRPTPIPSTTRQTEALRLTVSRRAGTEEALPEGIDIDTGEPVFTDPASDYRMADGSKSPTRVRIGALGEGKSTSLKTGGVMRPLTLGRLACVLDKKPMPGSYGALDVGEYTPICEGLGVEPLRFATDGSGLKINVLDPRIARVGSDQKGAGQTGLLRAALEETLSRPLSEKEGKALRVAHLRAIEDAREHGGIADIRHVIDPLLHPRDIHGPVPTESGAQADLRVSAAELREWGLDMAFALERCVEEDLAGLIDGPTDPRVQLTSSLTSFDISTLPDTGPALGITMAIIDTWTSSVQREMAKGGQSHLLHFNTEEAWWLAVGSFGAVAQRNIKIARSTGRINEFAFHHLRDIPADSPAMSIIKEAGSVMVYRQEKTEDAEQVVRELSLPSDAVDRIRSLPTGTFALWQPGRPLRYVQHLRSPLEVALTETDAAFIPTVVEVA